ncbi:MAG TPA: NAD-dependent DNA ligase LigA [Treponemataceae bacterium]|nr:NAD-dependent DNA ligase LigA [Treponemataceae bacterium]
MKKEYSVEELVSLIEGYQASYYGGEAEISDEAFDQLWDLLKEKDPDNPLLQKIGSDIGEAEKTKTGGVFQKVRHLIPMGSQEKAANPEEFRAWADKMSFKNFLVEYKLDGASLELQFEKGLFTRAVTRGDGEIGDDITKNVLKMQGLVKSLKDASGNRLDISGGVRAEVIMKKEIHKTYYPDKANCRNAANGLMKRKDGSGSEHLHILCYDAFFSGQEALYTNEKEKVLWIEKQGFEIVPFKLCQGANEVIDFRAQVMEEREGLDYDIDGLVVKGLEIDLADAERRRPEKQIAFKFTLEEAISIVKNIIWSESGVTYTPIAEFEPVFLAGTTVQRASLVNPNTIRNLGIKIGSHVVVTKRGEIIPKIEYVLEGYKHSYEKNENSLGSLFDEENNIFPTKCSACNTKLFDEGTRLFCPNKACPKRIHHRLEKWVASLDIRDLGIGLIEKLFLSGKLSSIKDFYSLTEDDLRPFFLNEESLEKEKESLGAKKVYQSIQDRKTLSLSTFIAGFDIEGFGETQIENLIQAGYKKLEDFFSASVDEIASVHGFGEISARNLVEGLAEHKEEMLFLISNKILVLREETEAALSGKSFCFTGELYTMKRSEAEALVKKNGGAVKSSVVKDLSFLVTNNIESGSSKNKKAGELGIPIIDEKEFLRLIGHE